MKRLLSQFLERIMQYLFQSIFKIENGFERNLRVSFLVSINSVTWVYISVKGIADKWKSNAITNGSQIFW